MLSSGTNNNFGLDLAVIGNGRTAALLEPASRLVWWCYPRFDGDPVFCRLLAGDEEKGFCDVVLDGMVGLFVGLRAQHGGRFHRSDRQRNASIRITDFAPRFRNYDRIFRPPQLIRIIEPISGLPRITIRVQADQQLWAPDHRAVARQQSHQLQGQGPRAAAHHRRAARLTSTGKRLSC